MVHACLLWHAYKFRPAVFEHAYFFHVQRGPVRRMWQSYAVHHRTLNLRAALWHACGKGCRSRKMGGFLWQPAAFCILLHLCFPVAFLQHYVAFH